MGHGGRNGCGCTNCISLSPACCSAFGHAWCSHVRARELRPVGPRTVHARQVRPHAVSFDTLSSEVGDLFGPPIFISEMDVHGQLQHRECDRSCVDGRIAPSQDLKVRSSDIRAGLNDGKRIRVSCSGQVCRCAGSIDAMSSNLSHRCRST